MGLGLRERANVCRAWLGHALARLLIDGLEFGWGFDLRDLCLAGLDRRG